PACLQSATKPSFDKSWPFRRSCWLCKIGSRIPSIRRETRPVSSTDPSRPPSPDSCPAASCAPLSAVLRPPKMILTPFFPVSDTKIWSRMVKNAHFRHRSGNLSFLFLKYPAADYLALLLPTSNLFCPL